MASRGHLVRGVLILGIGQLLTWIGGIAMAVLLPRYLGDANLGKFAFALGLTSLFGLAADLGTATYVMKEVARDRQRAPALVATALLMRLPLGLAAASGAVATVHLLGYDTITRQTVAVLSAGIVIGALYNVAAGAVQGLQLMKLLAAGTVLTKLGFAGLAAVWLLRGGGLREVAVAWVAGQVLGLLMVGVPLLRRVRLVPEFSRRSWSAIALSGLPFFVWQSALLIYGQVDAVLLSFWSSDSVVGWYSAAYRVVALPLFLPTIIATVVFPALSSTGQTPASFNAVARRALQSVVLLGAPIAVGIMTLPDRLIETLGYPSTFAHSVPPLVLLAPHIALVSVDMVIGTVLNARDRQRQWALTAVAAAVLNPVLNAIAIPYTQSVYGNGAIGAATVTTLTELFMLAMGLRLLPRDVFDRTTLGQVARCLLACLAMVPSMLLFRGHILPVPVLVGGLTYAGACLAFRAVSLSDIRLVWSHVFDRRVTSGVSV